MSTSSPRSVFQPQSIAGVRHVLCVASAKGGVGKSTVATNLAAAFHLLGKKVGILDLDIYGPSLPTIFKAYEKPRVTEDKRLIPLIYHGIKLMSIGFMVDTNSPIIWRGLMVQSATTQLLEQVDWGSLDILVIDLPPGTGDVQLTLAQKTKVDQAVVVTTPHPLALADSLRGIAMLQKVAIPVTMLIENMGHLECSACGHTSFAPPTAAHCPDDDGGADQLSKKADLNQKEPKSHKMSIERLPFDPRWWLTLQDSKPFVLAYPDDSMSQRFMTIARYLCPT